MYTYTCQPECEIHGGLLNQLHTHINHSEVASMVSLHDLDQIEEEAWYPLQRLFDVFNEVNSSHGAMMNFVSIGMAVAENALLPPNMNDAATTEFWQLWSDGYFYNHRNGNIGALDVEFPEDGRVRVIDTTPYPTDHIYGVIYGFFKRFNPRKSQYTVKIDPDVSRKEDGNDRSIFHIQWG